MSIFSSEAKLKKLVNWIAKIATLVVSAPATISIARQAYADVPGIAQWLVIGACVVLVEAAFIFFWIRVESRSNNIAKDAQLQASDVLGCWTMYGVLLYAGFLHGEGMFTLLFRASIGLLLFVATRDRLVATKTKLEELVAKGDYSSKHIAKLRRKSNEQVEKARIKKDKELRLRLVQEDPNKVLEQLAIKREMAVVSEQDLEIPTFQKTKTYKSVRRNSAKYKIARIDDQFEVSCNFCDFLDLKSNEISAKRAGNSHQRIHTNGNGHKKVKMLVTSTN